MAEALEERRRKKASPAAEAAMTCSSLPVKPSRRRVVRLGRSWGGGARVRRLSAVQGARDVAGAQRSVVVRRADEAVELELTHGEVILQADARGHRVDAS
jgi:hypothetical protein